VIQGVASDPEASGKVRSSGSTMMRLQRRQHSSTP